MPNRRPPVAAQKRVAPKRVNTPEVSVDDSSGSVTYSIAINKSLGDFNHVKIQASLTIPHGASDELIEELSDLMVVAKEKVIARVNEDIDELLKTT